jgi:integrase
MKLTKKTIDAIKPAEREALLWDDALPGFGLRVKPSGVKSFVLQYLNRQGRSRRLTLGRYGEITAEQARQKASALRQQVRDGSDPAEERNEDRTAPTVEVLCRQYLAECEKGLILGRGGKPKKVSTLATDQGRVERHIVPLMGRKLVRDIAPADVKAFLKDVATGKTAKTIKTDKLRGKAVVTGGKGTARRTVGLLGGIFSYAVENGYVQQNPVRGVKRGADGKREFRLEPDEYRALGRALENADAHGEHWQFIAITKLLALTGCRLGEIVKLTKAEVDLRSRAIRLADNKIRGAIIPLGESAARLLTAAMARSDEHCAYVFPAIRKSAQSYGGFAGAWERVVGKAYTAHGLRHAFGSTSDDLGLSELTIAALLGHSAAKKGSTTRGYIHKVDSVMLKAADEVSRHIEGMMSYGAGNVAPLTREAERRLEAVG